MSVVVDAKYHDEPKSSYTQEQLNRKSNSESILTAQGVKVNKNLPCLGTSDQTNLRSKNEVIDRIYALVIIAAKGEGIPEEQLKKPIEEKSIKSFSPKELSILESSELNDQDKAYATWRYESLNTLLWALKIMPDLKPPSEICDVQTIVGKILKPNRAEFTDQCELRSKEEILNELDKTFRMNWACVDARIKGEQVAGNINPSIIYERHYALNWLTTYQNQDWDEVQTNT